MGVAISLDQERSGTFGVAQLADRMAFSGLIGLILFAPLPLGSNRPWPAALLAIITWVSLLLTLPAYLGGRSLPVALQSARWPLGLAAMLCGLVGAQLFGGQAPSVVLGTLSPWDTEIYLLKALTYFGAMLLMVLTVRARMRCLWVLGCILAVGLCQACLGILLSRSAGPYEFMFEAFAPGSRVSGTFVNPNHFAGYLSLSLAAGIGLLVAQYDGGASRANGWRPRLAALLNFVLSVKMLLRLALVILVIGLVLSHSRMGNLAFFLALIAAGLLLAAKSPKLRWPALLLVGTMVIIDLFIVGNWVGFDRIAERFQGTQFRAESGAPNEHAEAGPESVSASSPLVGSPAPPREESVEERLQVPLLSAQLSLQRPWFGHGGGTFHLAFPPGKPDWVFAGYWSNAHNDFAEVAVDLGIVGLALWMGIGVFSLGAAVRLLSDRQPRLNRGVGTATLIAIIGTSLQSLMDFGLQIPANALNFSILLALSWLVAGLPVERRLGKATLDL